MHFRQTRNPGKKGTSSFGKGKKVSNETLKILMNLDKDNVYTKLATQCAPVIAGEKVSNLLTIRKEWLKDIYQIFLGTPVDFFVLSRHKDKISVLLYREDQLQEYLQREEVRNLLKELGYENCSIREIFPLLQKRYINHINNKNEFPHELGLILGYPAKDVAGFMANKGKNFCHNGYWKVYYSAEEATKTFSRYDMVKERAIRLLGSNQSVLELMKTG